MADPSEALPATQIVHAIHGLQPRDVRFRAEDLWPNGADPALVHAGVFQSYLERVG